MQLPVVAYQRRRLEAPAYWNMGILWIMLARAEYTAGVFTLMEQIMPNGPQAPPHLHETQEEAFYILEGKAIFTIGDNRFEAGAGDFLDVPKQSWHAFESLTQGLRVLNLYTPAGFERIIVEAGTPASRLTLPPPDLPAPDEALTRKLAAEVGMSGGRHENSASY